MNHYVNQLQVITEESLISFITCPYKFYYEFLEKKKRPYDWRQIVQHVVNKVVSSYYQVPIEQRHSGKVLSLIEFYWDKVSPQIFESRIQYYLVVAKMTDCLIQYLTTETKQIPPLFLFKRFNTYVEELDVDLSLTFDVAEWSESSFVIKKYLLEATPEMLDLYFHLSIVFSEKVLKRSPQRMEVVTLMDGKKHVFHPTVGDIEEGLTYLQGMKLLIEDSSGYVKNHNENECPVCPFQSICDRDGRKASPKKYYS
ncbi:hypothetical protein [Neobacillus jeddahensis]|uniref:hypothetical protein n=1 Tax=Neobacillus jeddahensis TaxID=1461580 RepID=UPI00058BB727|nr:hypothetical protein [Neobacillus jeddahensis]